MGYAGYSDTQAPSTTTTTQDAVDATNDQLKLDADAARLTIIKGVLSMNDDEVVSFQERFFQVEG